LKGCGLTKKEVIEMIRERFQTQPVAMGPESLAGEVDTATAVRDRSVGVIHGVHTHSLPLAGMTIGQARAELEERMNIDPEANPIVDGNDVDENYVLREGQVLNFLKAAGEKGSCG